MHKTHADPHPLAGKTVRLRQDVTDPVQKRVLSGKEYHVEDWVDRVAGESWLMAANKGNFAAVHYMFRVMLTNLPNDNEVVYGHIGSLGHLVHVSELEADDE